MTFSVLTMGMGSEHQTMLQEKAELNLNLVHISG